MGYIIKNGEKMNIQGYPENNNDYSDKMIDYSLQNISKIYPGTIALENVSINFYKGEIHGIIGKNGAGKSTLVNIMYGAEEPTAGKLFVGDKEVFNLTPSKAQSHKIYLIPQKINYALDMNVAETLFLGNYPNLGLGFINNKKLKEKAKEIIKKIGLNLEGNMLFKSLSLEQRRLIEIARALWVMNAQVIILDETTTALSIKPKTRLFEILKKSSKEENKTIIFITHRLEEIMEICDRVTVLRDGHTIKTLKKEDTSAKELAKYITGTEELMKINNSNINTKDEKKIKGPPYISIKNLFMDNCFKNINIDGSIGEIIGLVGMVGSGTSDLLRYLGGLISAKGQGEIYIDERKVVPFSPQHMIKNGVGYLTNNREEEGLFHTLNIKDNMIGSKYIEYSNKIGLIKHSKVNSDIDLRKSQLDIKMFSPDDKIDSLSGGNKQKVLVSRLLNYKLKVYLFDEVTEGIDIGARKALLKFIREVISKESVVLTASNVVADLLDICDRIFVMFHGEIIESFEKIDFNEHDIYSSLQGLRLA